MVQFLEQHYGIEVDAHEAGAQNFENIENIASFIRSKKGVAS